MSKPVETTIGAFSLRSLAPSEERRTSGSRALSWLLVLALVGVSNVFLLNNLIAVKLPSGQNLIGIRDVCLILVMLSLLVPMGRSRAVGALRDPVIVLTLYLACLTPLQGLVAIAHGAEIITVVRECFTMVCWILPFAIAVRLTAREDIDRLVTTIQVLSCALSIGVFIEAASLMRIRVVTSSAIVEGIIRPQPNGYSLMVVATSLSLVQFLRPELRFRQRWFHLAIIMMNLVAFIVTQSRTYVVGFLGSTLLYLVVASFARRSTVSLRRFGTLVLFGPAAVVGAIGAFSVVNEEFREQLLTRYKVFQTVSSAVEYTETDTRRLEVERAFDRFTKEPIVGVGLGAPYREPFDIFQLYTIVQDDGTIIHNVLGFFLVRFGIVGFLPFLLFCGALILQMVRAVRNRGAPSLQRVGLAVGVVNLLICALFANVFGVIEGVPGTMIAIGCCVAYALSDQERTAASRLPRSSAG